jgi:hypothetical protein
MVFRIILLCILGSSLSSCKLSEREVMVPAYIYINKPKFVTNSDNSQGFASAMINDLWLFDNEIIRGLYAVNAKVPVQREGITNIRLTNGVKGDGNGEQRIIYPMYTSYTQVDTLVPNKTDTVTATFTYLENAVFPFIEDYDGNGTRFEFNPTLKQIGDTVIRDNGPGAWLPGNNSGRIELKSAAQGAILEMYSQVYTKWPQFTPFFLEMDYKGNIPITVGLYATNPAGETSQFPMFITRPIENWNKLYLNMEAEINKRGAGIQYRLFFRFSKGSVANPEAWLDNIKIVYLD